jgi:hypothetical protein
MAPQSSALRSFASLVSVALLFACGGTTPFESGDAGTAGSSNSSTGGKAGVTGGAQGAGGKSSAGGTGATGVGGAVVCCLAMPVCNAGDTQIANQAACPPGAQCYSSSICCTQIWCAKATSDAGACNPSAEYNRTYAGTSPAQCALIDYSCPANTSMFSNPCGCGCEQAASCPHYVDCMPGPSTLNPLCSSSASCPYSIRAL